MPATSRLSAPDTWDYLAAGSSGLALARTARKIRVGGNGLLYLVKPGAAQGAGSLVGTFVAGQVLDIQFDGVGTSSTATDLCIMY